MKKLISSTFLLLLFSVSAFPHSGGTNSSGCHNDNINGGYHCHRGDHSELNDSKVEVFKSVRENEENKKKTTRQSS